MRRMYLIFEGFEREIIPIEKLKNLDELILVKVTDDQQKSFLSGNLKLIKEKLGMEPLLDGEPKREVKKLARKRRTKKRRRTKSGR